MRASTVESYGMRVFWSDADGGYVAVFSELPLISGFGATEEEALTELRDVLQAVVDVYRQRARPIKKRVAEPAVVEGMERGSP